jgi:intracellular sulfur oxidation DsrE/DsrF family protein
MGRALALVAVLGITGFYAFATRPDMRVVAQIADGNRAAVEQSLTGIESLAGQAAAEGDDAKIEVVVTGAALRQVRRRGPLYAQIVRLQTEGVLFAVGADALKRFKLPESQLPAGFLVVPSAPYEIARLQKRRFSYLRP